LVSVAALHAAVLLTSSALAVWAGVILRRRRTVPGALALGWMMFATAYWALLGALHAVIAPLDVRVAVAQLQYVGIVCVAPLWMTFASQYTRSRWIHDYALVALLWSIPIATLAIAFTNQLHHLLWTDVRPVEGTQRLQYIHGPWFWVALVYNYAVLATGTVMVIRALRHLPTYRQQGLFIVGGMLVPWAANVA
jgi:hypothetical protein